MNNVSNNLIEKPAVLFRVDYAFKKAMKNPTALKGLLAAILHIPVSAITSIIYLDTNTVKSSEDDKLSILDLFIELNSGERFNLEMQFHFFDYWENRTLVNISRKFLEPIKMGDRYENANLPKCIHIGILNFICKKEEPNFYNHYQLMNEETGILYSDRIGFHMIELPKLVSASEKEKNTKLYKWCQLFASDSWDEYAEIAKGDVSMEAAVEELKNISNSPEEERAYNNRMLALSDIATQTHAAEERGEARGEERGRVQGKVVLTKRLQKLAVCLQRDNRTEDALKALLDPDFQESLLKEYQI